MGSHWVLFLLYLNIVRSWPEDDRLRPKYVAKYNLIVIIASRLDVRCELTVHNILYGGPGRSVGVATGYGLVGPGSNPGWDEIFCPSRPALASPQPTVKWVPALYTFIFPYNGLLWTRFQGLS